MVLIDKSGILENKSWVFLELEGDQLFVFSFSKKVCLWWKLDWNFIPKINNALHTHKCKLCIINFCILNSIEIETSWISNIHILFIPVLFQKLHILNVPYLKKIDYNSLILLKNNCNLRSHQCWFRQSFFFRHFNKKSELNEVSIYWFQYI